MNNSTHIAQLRGAFPKKRCFDFDIEAVRPLRGVAELREALDRENSLPRAFLLPYEAGFPFAALKEPREHPDCPTVELLLKPKGRWQSSQKPRARLPSSQKTLQLDACVNNNAFRRAFAQLKNNIIQGDLYQGNLTRPFHAPKNTDLQRLFENLNDMNAVAHGAFLRFSLNGQTYELCSNSMETLFDYTKKSRRLRSFPIKGTRSPQSKTPLQNIEKERAEHLMIVDLVRNDIGRVAQTGSVRVPEFMREYSFAGVIHAISTVEGVLKPTNKLSDVVAALFPGGSITGAPKRRAMEILACLEARPRGYYTGSLIFQDEAGDVEASILIRTAFRGPSGHTTLSVGGGIVHDSVFENEVLEGEHKLRVFGETRDR